MARRSRRRSRGHRRYRRRTADRYAPEAWTRGHADTVAIAALLVLLAGIAAITGTRRGRRWIARLHTQAREAAWLERALYSTYRTHWIQVAGFRHPPELVPRSGRVSGRWGRLPDDALSVLPCGDVPTRLSFLVKPAASGNTDPGRQQAELDDIAERFRAATSFGGATATGDHAGIVTVTLTLTQAIPAEQLEVVDPVAALDDMVAYWDPLLAALELTDRDQDQVTELVSWRPVGDVVDGRPEAVEGSVRPGTVHQDPAVIDRHLTAVAAFLGFVAVDADPPTGPDRGVVFTFWRDGRPPLLPVPAPDLASVYPEAKDLIFPNKRVPPPDLIAVDIGPIAPEQTISTGDWRTARPSILAEPRPTYFHAQFDVEGPDAPAVAGAWAGKLGYYRTVPDWEPRHGLTVKAYRDRLPQGKLVPVDTLAAGGDNEMTLGEAYGSTIAWRWDNNPHVLVAGEAGAGKGDAIALILAGMQARDWLIVYGNPKGTSEVARLAEGTCEVRDVEQAAAAVELAVMECARRNYLLREASKGRWVPEGVPVTSLRDIRGWRRLAAEVEAAGGQLPHFGPRVGFVLDEIQQWANAKNNDTEPHTDARRRFQNGLESYARMFRSTGGHLVAVTQDPLYDAVGGSAVVANLTFVVLLRVVKESGFRFIPGMTPDDKVTLKEGPGRGHCFTLTFDEIDDAPHAVGVRRSDVVGRRPD